MAAGTDGPHPAPEPVLTPGPIDSAGRLGRAAIVALGMLLCAVALLVGWWVTRDTRPDEPPALLRDFRFESLTGGQLGPPDLRGQVVVVDFWATWCGPCHVQARILDGLVREMGGDRGVAFLGVSVGEAPDTVRTFFDGRPQPYPMVVDEEGRLSSEAGIYALPTVMVLDREGKVVLLNRGLTTARALRQAIETAQAPR